VNATGCDTPQVPPESALAQFAPVYESVTYGVGGVLGHVAATAANDDKERTTTAKTYRITGTSGYALPADH
jgi:predicted secreted Zn-dependent protease